MARWEQGTPVESAAPRWQQGAIVSRPGGQRLVQAGAAGASRGVLGTLDIIPRGIAAVINPALQAVGLPAWQGAPFQSLAAPAGIGTYQPQTPGEESAAFAGELVGASVLPAAGATKAASLAAQSVPRALGLESAATGTAIGGGFLGEAIGGPEGRTVGAIAGGLVPAAAPLAARQFTAPYRFEGGGGDFLQRVEASRRQNVPITAGQAAGGSFLEKATATLPGGQRAAATFAERQAARMGERVDELVRSQSIAEPSSEAAGRAIQRGLDEWVTGFRTRQGQLYDDVDQLIPPQTMTPMSNMRAALEGLTTPSKYDEWAKILDPSMLRRLQTALDSADEVPYELLKTIRSRVGEKLDNPEMLAGLSKGAMKRLYGALSRDMEDVAQTMGPEAERAAARANNYTRAGHQRVDDFLEPLQRQKLPEKAYQTLMSGTKEGASRLRALKKSVSPEQWNVVVATTLRRLGRARPSERTSGDIGEMVEDFSPETFLTSIEQLDPAAQRALFTGSRYVGLQRDLDDLKDIAQGIREQRQAAFNPSGTTGALGNISWLSALPFINPMTTLRLGTGVIGNLAGQKALQSPALLNYLATPTAMTPSMAGQLTRAGQVLER